MQDLNRVAVFCYIIFDIKRQPPCALKDNTEKRATIRNKPPNPWRPPALWFNGLSGRFECIRQGGCLFVQMFFVNQMAALTRFL